MNQSLFLYQSRMVVNHTAVNQPTATPSPVLVALTMVVNVEQESDPESFSKDANDD